MIFNYNMVFFLERLRRPGLLLITNNVSCPTQNQFQVFMVFQNIISCKYLIQVPFLSQKPTIQIISNKNESRCAFGHLTISLLTKDKG